MSETERKPKKAQPQTQRVEGPSFELKSKIAWTNKQERFHIIKTIVAFANCEGGQIFIEDFVGETAQLDSARLHDAVNQYVSPPINGITSEETSEGWEISVLKSASAPHVFEKVGNYEKSGKQQTAFRQGQIFVRHGSKSEPATGDDLQKLIREGVASWLGGLGAAVAKIGVTTETSGPGMPVRIVDGGPAINISVTENYPYSAQDLGAPYRKTGAWIGRLVNRENMRDDKRYTEKRKINSTYICTYSEAAKSRIGDILQSDPSYNPYKRDR